MRRTSHQISDVFGDMILLPISKLGICRKPDASKRVQMNVEAQNREFGIQVTKNSKSSVKYERNLAGLPFSRKKERHKLDY